MFNLKAHLLTASKKQLVQLYLFYFVIHVFIHLNFLDLVKYQSVESKCTVRSQMQNNDGGK